MALLGSPKVRFSLGTSAALKFVGLSEVLAMHTVAQKRRQEKGQSSQLVRPELKRVESWREDVKRDINQAMSKMQRTATRHFLEHEAQNVEEVTEIISAKFGYESLTADFVDVTDEVRKYLHNGVLMLKDVNLRNAFGHKAGIVKGLDNLRSGLLQKKRELIITFRFVPRPEKFIPQVNGLLSILSNSGMTAQLHVNDGEYTWYKLTEWMQVEMLQIFGQFLETSVWYRFPYTQFLRIYFETLYAETLIVQKRHGTKKAYASSGFVMSFVPGIMMSVLMGQLQLSALPLTALPSTSGFGAERDRSRLHEQLVVQQPAAAPIPKWSSLHPGLREVEQLVPGLHVLHAPAMKALTPALLALARQVPALTLLEVSNQGHIQMRVLLREPAAQLPKLHSIKGCEVMLQFEYPTNGTSEPPGINLALCVTVPYLLSSIRACDHFHIEIVQIYDFWCG